jgi:hypothetical protein
MCSCVKGGPHWPPLAPTGPHWPPLDVTSWRIRSHLPFMLTIKLSTIRSTHTTRLAGSRAAVLAAECWPMLTGAAAVMCCW